MPVARLEQIKRFLHFCNNEEAPTRDDPNYDRAFKIRHVINHINTAFQKCREPEKQQSIDERMVKFEGHNIMRQYVKTKPVKWGFKLWMRCGSKSGYTYEMDVYTGKAPTGNQSQSVGVGEKVVFNLTKSLIGTGCMIFMDNFFSSPYLFVTLQRNGMMATGTVRQNRKHLPKNLKADKEMEKGEVLAFQTNDSGLNFIKWKDTKAVHVLSNHVSAFDSVAGMRKQKGTSEKKDVSIPLMVKAYNQHMGGVDLANQMKGTYAIDLRSRYKYYLRLFFDVLDTAVVNSYVIYNELHVADGKKT